MSSNADHCLLIVIKLFSDVPYISDHTTGKDTQFNNLLFMSRLKWELILLQSLDVHLEASLIIIIGIMLKKCSKIDLTLAWKWSHKNF